MRKWVSLKRCKTITALLVAAVMLLTAGVAFAEEGEVEIDVVKKWVDDEPENRPDNVVLIIDEETLDTLDWAKEGDEWTTKATLPSIPEADDIEELSIPNYDTTIEVIKDVDVESATTVEKKNVVGPFDFGSSNYLAIKLTGSGADFAIWTQEELQEALHESFVASLNSVTSNDFGEIKPKDMITWLFGNGAWGDISVNGTELTIDNSAYSKFVHGTYEAELYILITNRWVGTDTGGGNEGGGNEGGNEEEPNDNPGRPRNPRRPSIPLGAGTEEEFDAIPLGLPQTGDANSLYGLFVIVSGMLLAAGAATVSRKAKQK